MIYVFLNEIFKSKNSQYRNNTELGHTFILYSDLIVFDFSANAKSSFNTRVIVEIVFDD